MRLQKFAWQNSWMEKQKLNYRFTFFAEHGVFVVFGILSSLKMQRECRPNTSLKCEL